MKQRFSRLFGRRSKTLLSVPGQDFAQAPDADPQINDLHPCVQLRLKSDSVPPFRTVLNVDIDKEALTNSILTVEEIRREWNEVAGEVSVAISVYKLQQRLQFFAHMHGILIKQFSKHYSIPYSVVQFLLITIQDKFVSLASETCFADMNPFASSKMQETLIETLDQLVPALEVVEYCVAREGSCLLLHNTALSIFVDAIDLFTRSFETLGTSESERIIELFVSLAFHASHCLYALGEMCKSHSGYITSASESFSLLSGKLQRLLEVLLCDIYLQKVSEVQYEFLTQDLTQITEQFHIKPNGPVDFLYVLLYFNFNLARKSPEIEQSLTTLTLKYLFPVVITTLRKHKHSSNRDLEVEAALEKSLMCLQLLRNFTHSQPERLVTLIQDHSGKLNDCIYYHAWYYLTQRRWEFSNSFASDRSRLGRLYSLLYDLLCGGDAPKVQDFPISIFLTLLELDLVEKCKEAPPVIQVYTLELVTSYLVSTGTTSSSYMLESCLLDLILSPLFFTGGTEALQIPGIDDLLERCAEHITTILRVIKEREGGKVTLMKNLCNSVRFYKEFPIYLSKTSELISTLTSDHDEDLIQALVTTSTAEHLFITLQDSHEGVVPTASIECLKVIIVKLLDIPEVAEQVLRTRQLIDRLMKDLVTCPHLTEFYIHCVSRLMKFHPEDRLFAGYLEALRQAETPGLMRSLLQGLEASLSGNTKFVVECQSRLINAGVFNVLLHTLEKSGDLETCSVVLPVFRAVLHKSKVSRRNLTPDLLVHMRELMRIRLRETGHQAADYDIGASNMIDNLLYIMFDTTELHRDVLTIRLPEFLSITLDLVIDFPNQALKIEYLRLLERAVETSVKCKPSLAQVTSIQTHAISALISGIQRSSDVQTVSELSTLFISLATHHLDPSDLVVALQFLNTATNVSGGPGFVVLQCLAASCQKSIDTFVGVDERNKEYEVFDGTSQDAFLFTGKETHFSVVPADNRSSLFAHNKSFSGFAWVKPEANDQFPLQCIFVLLCKENKSASLHVTSSGSLQFMYLNESHILYEALTETEKLIFNKWNFVALSYQKGKRMGKKTEFALFINGRKCAFQDAGSLKFPKTMFAEVQMGNREGGDCLKGLISYMYFLSQPLSLCDVQQLFKLGVNYPGFFQPGDVCHAHWKTCDMLDLRSSMVLGVSPRIYDSQGHPIPFSVSGVPDKTPLDPLGKRRTMQTLHSVAMFKGVKRFMTVKFISAVHTVGGLTSFLPLLRRANGAYVAETLKLFSAFCSVPNNLTHREIMSGFCDMLESLLSELKLSSAFEESIAIDAIQLVDSLHWSSEAKTKALEALLLRYRVWAHTSWETQRIVLMNLFRLLATHYREVRSRVETLRKALDLMSLHFSRIRPNVSAEVLKARRMEVMDLVRSELLDATLNEDEACEVFMHMVYQAKLCTDNASAFLSLLRDLLNSNLLSLTELTKSRLIPSLAFVLKRAAKKQCFQLQAEAMVAMRLVYGAEEPEIEDIPEQHKPRSISLSEYPANMEDSMVIAYDQMISHRLTVDLYKALLGFLLSVPQDYAGKFLYAELHEDDMSITLNHKIVLSIIVKRLKDADLEVLSDFSLLCCSHILAVYEREEFPGWVLNLLSDLRIRPNIDCERRVMDLIGGLFSSAILSLRNGCAKLRSLAHALVLSKEDEKWSLDMLLRIFSSICSRLDQGLSVEEIAVLGQKVYHNIHDLVYILEDSIHILPRISGLPNYLPLVKQILDLCAKLNLMQSTYPNLTLLSYPVLLRLLTAEANEQVDWTVQRKREGGMLRALLKLLLVAMHDSSDDQLSMILHYIHCVLSGGSAEGLMCSAITRANKVQMYEMLRDYVEERLCRVLDDFPATEDDMVYSEKFLLLYVFVECSEQFLERVDKHQDATPLARFIASLLKHNKLSHHINLYITKETANTRQEYYEFLRVFGGSIRTTSRQFYYRQEPLACTTAVSHYRRSLGTDGAADDLEVERKSFIRKALRLMQTLTAAQDSIERLYSVLSSPEYQTTLHLYLTIETSMKVGVVDHVINSLPAPQETDWVPFYLSLDTAKSVLKDIHDTKIAFLLELDKRHKQQRSEADYEKTYFRKRVQAVLKELAGECGLWTEGPKPVQFWKQDHTQDCFQRSLFLKPDPHGSSHADAINRKYKKSSSIKRSSFPDAIDDDLYEEKRLLIRSRSHIPPETADTEILNAMSPAPQLNISGEFHIVELENNPVMCERISIKGSHFGILEITTRFLVFRSDGTPKPPDRSFGSALAWTAILKPCEKLWAYSDLLEVISRRFNHQHSALELLSRSGKSYLFNCFTTDARTEVLQALKVRTTAKVIENPVAYFNSEGFTQDWRSGKLTNFEYLMTVNKFASRSFNDLNQYPVFPWILTNYTAARLDTSDSQVYRDLGLPIGALDPDSEQEAKRRYSHWEHDEVIQPFHYGSHYCTSGIVLHYLVRLEPYTTQAIALQDGHFDVADRLFASLDNAWQGSLKNSGDYKELVPEFFFLPEFLLNLNKYNFGVKQSGDPVTDVNLPNWAENVYQFVLLHRLALESKTVSDNLHRWLDLIFGYKQQGREAVNATNVFFYITYESNCKAFFQEDVSKDGIAEGIAEQIAQYGQTPVLLFKDQHPRKTDSARVPSLIQKNMQQNSKLGLFTLLGNDDQIACFFVLKQRLLLVTFSGVLKVFKWKGLGSELIRDVEVHLDSVPNQVQNSDSEPRYGLVEGCFFSCGYTDGSFKVHDLDSGKLLASVWFHSKKVTCLSADDPGLLTGSDDATLALWNIQEGKCSNFSMAPELVLRGHRSGVRQCSLKSNLCMAVSLDQRGEVLLYSTRKGDVRKRLMTTGSKAICLTGMGWTCVFTEQGRIVTFSTTGNKIAEVDCGMSHELAPQVQTTASMEHVIISGRSGIAVTQLMHTGQVAEKWRVQGVSAKCTRFSPGEQCALVLGEDNSLLLLDAVTY